MDKQQEESDSLQQSVRDLADISYLNELHRNVFRHYIIAILNGAVWRDGLPAVHSWKQKQWDQIQHVVEQAVQLEIAMGRQHNYTMVLRPVAATKEKDNGV